MIKYSLTNFLHSLCLFMVQQAALEVPAVTLQYNSGLFGSDTPPLPRNLWRERVDERSAGDPYGVMKIYGGPPLTWHPLLRTNVQCQVVASQAVGDEAGLDFCFALFTALIFSNGAPIRMQDIEAWTTDGQTLQGAYRLVSIDALQRPGFTGRDDRGRGTFTFNLAVGWFGLLGT